MATLNFNAAEVLPQESFDPMPPGKYTAFIVESEMKRTSKGDGEYLQFTWEIADGEYKGRKVWNRLNLVNPNQTAMEIAYRELSAICHAVGRIQVQDSSELHGLACRINLKIRPAKNGYEATNDIKGYEAMQSAPGPQLAPAATQAPAVAPQTPKPTLPPWKR